MKLGSPDSVGNESQQTTASIRFGWNAAAVAVEHTVTFDPNAGEGTMDPQTAAEPTGLTPNAFTREGYEFVGWNTEPTEPARHSPTERRSPSIVRSPCMRSGRPSRSPVRGRRLIRPRILLRARPRRRAPGRRSPQPPGRRSPQGAPRRAAAHPPASRGLPLSRCCSPEAHCSHCGDTAPPNRRLGAHRWLAEPREHPLTVLSAHRAQHRTLTSEPPPVTGCVARQPGPTRS
ncbi:InlB B-repeat-containing protein [Leucobacter chromiiresistens]